LFNDVGPGGGGNNQFLGKAFGKIEVGQGAGTKVNTMTERNYAWLDCENRQPGNGKIPCRTRGRVPY